MLALCAIILLLAYFFEPNRVIGYESVQVIEYRTHQTKYGTKPYAVVQMQDGRTLHMGGYPDRAQRDGGVCARISEGMLFGGTRVNIALKQQCIVVD